MQMAMKTKYVVWLILFLIFTCSHQAPEPGDVKMMWFDATANWERLSTPESLGEMIGKCADAGITDIVIDVKPITGQVLYRSDIAPRMHVWKGVVRDSSYDFLAQAIHDGHKSGLKVHAAMNVFSEGNRIVGEGLVFSEHPEWQSILHTPQGLFPISKVEDKISMFVNPVREDVIRYELSLIEELVSNYNLDGLILDRGRYDSIQSDFSEISRTEFEAFLGKALSNWPEDIYRWEMGDDPGRYQRVNGLYFKEWIFWRSKIISKFFKKARDIVKNTNPHVLFGDYAGSWYPTYYELGVNWASKKYQPDYSWATDNYNETGYAEFLDFFCSGCYYEEVYKSDLDTLKDSIAPERWEAAMGSGKDYWYCVEGACEMSMAVTKNTIPVYGSIYVLQYHRDPEKFRDAVRMCMEKTNGVMIFDIVYIEQYKWWDHLKNVLKNNDL
jgi:uncharacterized lipoprotein YddW (UPF0748 family)